MSSRKQFCFVVVLAVLMCLVAGPNLLAQKQEEESTATLKETMDSLGSKLSDRTFLSFISVDSVHWRGYEIVQNFKHYNEELNATFTTDNCNLILKNESSIYGCRECKYIDELVLPFADIDPLSIEHFVPEDKDSLAVMNSGLKMRTTSPKKTITFKRVVLGTQNPSLKPIENSEKVGSNAFLFFQDKESELRAKRAIKHAVKLCGGKVDPF